MTLLRIAFWFCLFFAFIKVVDRYNFIYLNSREFDVIFIIFYVMSRSDNA